MNPLASIPFNLDEFGDPIMRVKHALVALRKGNGVLVLDDQDRENEGDIVWAAETITAAQMAFTIRYGSGIVCLALPRARCTALALPMMVAHNTNKNRTAFTVSIEAATGVTTGVSAQDRVTTIRAAIAADARAEDLHRPGHVYPLVAAEGGVLTRRGHTEGTLDLVQLAGLRAAGVLCELMNDNGTMAKASQVVQFARCHNMPVVTIEDIVRYRQQ